MRQIRVLLFAPLVALLSGCIPIPVVSLYPLGSKETWVRDDRLLGTWVHRDKDWLDAQTWTVSRHPKETGTYGPYLLKSTFKDQTRKFRTDIVKVGEELYLDCTPELDDPASTDTIHAHFFARLILRDDVASVQLLDSRKLLELLEKQPKLLSSEGADGKICLTSKTPELQAFLRESGDRVLHDPIVFRREDKPK